RQACTQHRIRGKIAVVSTTPDAREPTRGAGSLISPMAMSRLARFALLEEKVGQCQAVEVNHGVIL
ncbi:hypothetical protein AB7849_19390, partial [Rhodanobacter sp. 115]|uniref:hypothetical protein n=1 Tax=Rhodanobacter sp. FW021-MT20 TaxID=1162282 RepID=UPI0034E439A3